MKISTSNNGEDYTIEIEDDNAVFSFELTIFNKDGRTYIDYVNSSRESYNLLNIENNIITNEVPTQE